MGWFFVKIQKLGLLTALFTTGVPLALAVPAQASLETFTKKLNSLKLNPEIIQNIPTRPLVYNVVVGKKKPDSELEKFLNVLWLDAQDAAGARKSLINYKVGKTIAGSKIIGRSKESGLDCLNLRELDLGYNVKQCWKIGKQAAIVFSHTYNFPDSKLKDDVLKVVLAEKL